MTTVNSLVFSYNATTKTFYASGKRIKFDTCYSLLNIKSNKTMEFDFTHSTGSEWDPKTLWVYKSKCGNYILHVGNDEVTPAHAQAYLNHKMNN
jgi:hypothetical protein